MWVSMQRRKTYLGGLAPNAVPTQAVDSTLRSLNGMELDAESDKRVDIVGLDMEDVANRAESIADGLDSLGDDGKVSVGEGEVVGLVNDRIDLDGQTDLALELIDETGIALLDEGILVRSGVLDDEPVLLQEIFGDGGLLKIIKGNEDTAQLDEGLLFALDFGYSIEEASILDGVSVEIEDEGKRLTGFI